jgi:hypothetical protein
MSINNTFRTLTANNIEGVTSTRNYLKSAFENGTISGWSLFNTTLTSGVPTGSVSAGASSLTLGTTSTNPLSEAYSLQLVGAAAVTAGQGFISDVFTIDRQDQAQVLTALYNFEVVSGASNANFSGILGSQSFAMYIRDVTNSVWIQPAGFLGMVQSAGPGKSAPITFQTAAVGYGNQYQLAFVCLQATAGAITINFDSFKLGPISANTGVPATDWASYPLVIGATTTAPTPGTNTSSAKWRRIGDSMEITYTFSQTSAGSSGTGTYLFPLPTGMSIDLTKVTVTTNPSGLAGTVVGSAFTGTTTASATNYSIPGGAVVPYNSTNLAVYAASTYGQVVPIGAGNTSLAGSPTYFSFTAIIPIAGWSSNVDMSQDTDTRVVAFRAYKNGGAITIGNNIASYTVIQEDTAGAWNNTTGVYTVPVSGEYIVTVTQGGSNSGNNAAIVYNGSIILYGPADIRANATTAIKCNAGDTISNQISSNTTLNSDNISTSISIWRLSGPSVIAASESVNASYSVTSATTATAGSPINYDTKLFDSHNAVSNGTFTAPISGIYQIEATHATGGNTRNFFVYKNGALYRNLFGTNGAQASNDVKSGSTMVKLNAGDTLFVTINTTTTLSGDGTNSVSNANNMAISKVGN